MSAPERHGDELLLAVIEAARSSAYEKCGTYQGEPRCLYLDDDLDPLGMCSSHTVVELLEQYRTETRAAA